MTAAKGTTSAMNEYVSNRMPSGEGSGAGEGGGYRSERPAPQRAAAGAPRGGAPSWEAPKGGDLDDEIPF